MAAEIKKQKGVDVEIVPGGRSSFEVYVDDGLVFSKLQRGRFPTSEDEVIALL